MDTLATEVGDSAINMSYVLREEEQLAQTWTEADQVEHERIVRENTARLNEVRQALDEVRIRSDLLWERFITLTLERLFTNQLKEFLDRLDGEILALTQRLVEADCEIDRLRAHLQKQRYWLANKIAILESLAHRTSLQTYLNMMLARIEGLERQLLGSETDRLETASVPDQRQINLPSDLLYIRVRLSTTRIALLAANRSQQLGELDTELMLSLPEIERHKTTLIALTTRIECISELSRYWLAYLEIAREKAK